VGADGVVYVARPGFDRLSRDSRLATRDLSGSILQVQHIAPPRVDATDTTGCGDVFGATCFARLLAGDDVPVALDAANRAAARNAVFRGATGLPRHLRGELVLT